MDTTGFVDRLFCEQCENGGDERMNGKRTEPRSSSAELIAEIDEANEAQADAEARELLEQRLAMLGVSPDDEIGEAERAAATSPGPAIRGDGHPVTTPIRRRPLSPSQLMFAQGVISGLSRRESYRRAYPNAKGTDATISASAHKLGRDPRIARLIEQGWSETAESLAEDRAAVERYVMRQLVSLSKAGRQEGSRLKALELLGRASGLWRDKPQTQDQPTSAEHLRRELAQHLKALRVVEGGRRVNGKGEG